MQLAPSRMLIRLCPVLYVGMRLALLCPAEHAAMAFMLRSSHDMLHVVACMVHHLADQLPINVCATCA